MDPQTPRLLTKNLSDQNNGPKLSQNSVGPKHSMTRGKINKVSILNCYFTHIEESTKNIQKRDGEEGSPTASSVSPFWKPL